MAYTKKQLIAFLTKLERRRDGHGGGSVPVPAAVASLVLAPATLELNVPPTGPVPVASLVLAPPTLELNVPPAPAPQVGGSNTATLRFRPTELFYADDNPHAFTGYAIRTFVGSARRGRLYVARPRTVGASTVYDYKYDATVSVTAGSAGITVSDIADPENLSARVITITGVVAGKTSVTITATRPDTTTETVTVDVIVEPAENPAYATLPTLLDEDECPPPSADALEAAVTVSSPAAAAAAVASGTLQRGSVVLVTANVAATAITQQLDIYNPTGTGKGWTYVMGASGQPASWDGTLTDAEADALPRILVAHENGMVRLMSGTKGVVVRGLSIRATRGFQNRLIGLLQVGDNQDPSTTSQQPQHNKLWQVDVRGDSYPVRISAPVTAAARTAVVVGNQTHYQGTYTLTSPTLPASAPANGKIRFRMPGIEPAPYMEKPLVTNGVPDGFNLFSWDIESYVNHGNGTATVRTTLWENGAPDPAPMQNSASVAEIHDQWAQFLGSGVRDFGRYTVLARSRVSDCGTRSQDSQMVSKITGGGPFTVRFNRLLGVCSEALTTAGGAIWGEAMIPSDVVFADNAVLRGVHRGQLWGGHWVTKNGWETKMAIRMLVERNKFDYIPIGDGGQWGVTNTIKSTRYGSGSGLIEPEKMYTRDVVVRDNWTTRAVGGTDLVGYQTSGGGDATRGLERVIVRNNLWTQPLGIVHDRTGNAPQFSRGTGFLYLASAANAQFRNVTAMELKKVLVTRNTMLQVPGVFIWTIATSGADPGEAEHFHDVQITENVIRRLSGATFGCPGFAGQAAWDLRAADGSTFAGNAVIDGAQSEIPSLTTGNTFPPYAGTGRILFAGDPYGDDPLALALAAGDARKGTATGGADPGCDVALVAARTRRAALLGA